MKLEYMADESYTVLAELEACSFRNKGFEETKEYMTSILDKHMPLSQNSSRSPALQEERRKDHYSHFILRLAFSSTEDLRSRFVRLESQLFKLRFQDNDARDRQEFVEGLNFDWEKVGEAERRELSAELQAANPGAKRLEEDGYFKVDWERVPELVEKRLVFLKRGKAYVPVREQTSMVVSEFTRRLHSALEVSVRVDAFGRAQSDRFKAHCPRSTTLGRRRPSLANSSPSIS